MTPPADLNSSVAGANGDVGGLKFCKEDSGCVKRVGGMRPLLYQ